MVYFKTLQEWREANGVSRREMAVMVAHAMQELGLPFPSCHKTNIYRYEKGFYPSWKVMRAVIVVTNGEVQPNSWFNNDLEEYG